MYKKMIFNIYRSVIISPNEVLGDVMVLASPLPRALEDPDDMNTLTRKKFKCYMWVDLLNAISP